MASKLISVVLLSLNGSLRGILALVLSLVWSLGLALVLVLSLVLVLAVVLALDLVRALVLEILFLEVLGFLDDDLVGEDLVDASDLAGEVGGQHDLDLDSHNSLLEEDVSDGDIDEVSHGLSGRDEVALFVLHGLGTLLAELSGNDDLAALDLTEAHNASDDEHGSGPDGSALEELGLQELDLGGGGKTLVLDGLEVDDDVAFLEAETLLDEGFEFVTFDAVLAEGGLFVDDLDGDDDTVDGVLDGESAVAGGEEGTGQELVYFSVENSVCHEFLLFANLLDVGHCLLSFIIFWKVKNLKPGIK